jgi:hypothetical protein
MKATSVCISETRSAGESTTRAIRGREQRFPWRRLGVDGEGDVESALSSLRAQSGNHIVEHGEELADFRCAISVVRRRPRGKRASRLFGRGETLRRVGNDRDLVQG